MKKYWWIPAGLMLWSAFAAGWAITCLVLGVEIPVNAAALILNILTFYLTWGWWRVEPKPVVHHTLDEEVEAELHRFRKDTGQLD